MKAEVESEAEGLELQGSVSLPKTHAFPLSTFYILGFHVKVNLEMVSTDKTNNKQTMTYI